jgi:two-component system, NarL family, nitrate/nitrite response regulator NarL
VARVAREYAVEVRVLVASEVRLYREGLQRVLQGIAGIALVGIASCAEEVFAQAAAVLPTVILLDVAMARSVSVVKQLSRRTLHGGIVVFGIPEGGGVMHALPQNILGYVTREGSIPELLAAIRSADRGELYCSSTLVPFVAARVRGAQARPTGGIAQLTARELEILELVREGFSNKAISRQLGIGLSTVKNHVHSVLAKLGVHCRSEAIAALNRHEGFERVQVAPSLGVDDVPALASAVA